MFPLTPCCKGMAGATSVSLGCLVSGYLPMPVTVTWDTGSLNKSVATVPATFDQTSGLHNAISQVTSWGEWAKHTFTCSVAHAASPAINKTFRGEPGAGGGGTGGRERWTGSHHPAWSLPAREGPGGRRAPWAQGGQPRGTSAPPACAMNFSPPSVKLFHSSCNPLGDTHTTIQLLCLISGYVPGDMEVIWLVDGQRVTDMFSYTAPGTQEGNVTSTHSELNITQGEWVSQKTYTCRVSYQGFHFEDHALKCTGTGTHPPTPRPMGLLREGRGLSSRSPSLAPQSPTPAA